MKLLNSTIGGNYLSHNVPWISSSIICFRFNTTCISWLVLSSPVSVVALPVLVLSSPVSVIALPVFKQLLVNLTDLVSCSVCSRSCDFLPEAFNCFRDCDYCIITLPHLVPEFPLLQQFVVSPSFTYCISIFHSLVPEFPLLQQFVVSPSFTYCISIFHGLVPEFPLLQQVVVSPSATFISIFHCLVLMNFINYWCYLSHVGFFHHVVF